MSRVLAGALALPLGITGCGHVVFDPDDDAAVPGAGTTASATTQATGGPSEGGGSAGGDGGASTTGGTSADGGGGAAPAPEPITSCRTLAWYGEPLVHPLNAQHVSHGLALEHVARADDPLGTQGSIAVVVPYAEPDPDEHEEGVQFLEAWHTWEESVVGDHSRDAHLREGDQHEWADPEAVPVRTVGAGRGGFTTYVREGQRDVRERIAYGGFPLPAGLAGVTDLAWSDRGVYALVHGAPEAPLVDLVVPSAAATSIATELAACADRPVPLDVAALGDGFLVAAAPGAAGRCDGAPTAPARLTLTLLDDVGGVVAERELAVDGAPREITLLPHEGGAWLAVRTEGSDAIGLMSLDQGGATTAATSVPLPADRAVALARRLDELAVVDLGGAVLEARIRTFAPDLSPIAETPPVPLAVAPSGPAVVAVRPDAGAFLVATIVRTPGAPELVTALRARCVEEVAR